MSNETKVNIDISDSTNEIIKNTLSKPSKSVGNACGIVLDFLTNTLLLPMQKYNIKARFQLENYAKELENRLMEIPTDKLAEPKINVIGPAFESLKYNMDEKDIKEMFTNLIIKSVNKDYKESVTPAFIDIIKQLSSEDAKYIKKIYEISKKYVPIIKLKLEYPKGFTDLTNYAIISGIDNYFFIDDFILDNLLRLKLVQIPHGIYLINTNYENIFNKIKEQPELKFFPIPNNAKLSYSEGKLEFTSFGKKFIDICLS